MEEEKPFKQIGRQATIFKAVRLVEAAQRFLRGASTHSFENDDPVEVRRRALARAREKSNTEHFTTNTAEYIMNEFGVNPKVVMVFFVVSSALLRRLVVGDRAGKGQKHLSFLLLLLLGLFAGLLVF